MKSQAVHLRKADRRLHVGDLQIIAEMRIGVFVVIAIRQVAELPAEALFAGVVACPDRTSNRVPSRGTIQMRLSVAAVGEDGAAFAHRDVVRGIEAQRPDIAERADRSCRRRSRRSASQLSSTTQIVLLRERSSPFEIERIAERMRDHDGAGFR